MSAVRFSVLISSYNHAKFIRDAVDSALSQLYTPYEVIVVDDGSSDDSVALLKSYGDAIQLIEHASNQGISRARNSASSRARGDYLVYLDGDDLLKPWALLIHERMIRALHPKVILNSLTWFEGSPPAASPDDVPHNVEFVRYETLVEKDRTFRSSASAMVIERRAVEDVHGWTEGMSLMQDQDLVAKLAFSGLAIQVISPATVLYRTHGTNASKNVRSLIDDAYKLVAAYKERRVLNATRRNRLAGILVGGPVFFVIKSAYHSRLYREVLKLVVHTWPCVTVAALARIRVHLFGRRPSQILTL